jgi:hypothetical protein
MSLAFQDWKILLLQPIVIVFLEQSWQHINYDKSCHYPSRLEIIVMNNMEIVIETNI